VLHHRCFPQSPAPVTTQYESVVWSMQSSLLQGHPYCNQICTRGRTDIKKPISGHGYSVCQAQLVVGETAKESEQASGSSPESRLDQEKKSRQERARMEHWRHVVYTTTDTYNYIVNQRDFGVLLWKRKMAKISSRATAFAPVGGLFVGLLPLSTLLFVLLCIRKHTRKSQDCC
jgi:hypothetical protein